LQLSPPVPIDTYSNVLKCWLLNVCELLTSSTTINISSVKDVTSIFHISILEYDLPNCARMPQVFYSQYRYDDSVWLVEVDSHHHHSMFFHVSLGRSPSCIWYSILEVMEKENTYMIQSNTSCARRWYFCTVFTGSMGLIVHEFGEHWCSGGAIVSKPYHEVYAL
jgi:hypothetical protein